MNVIIVEDEAHSCRLLRGMIETLRPEWQVIGEFDSVSSTAEWLGAHSAPDLIFLDIQLSDGISFSIFESVEVQSMVIFTTAYDEYAIQAFELNSIDYLLKPLKTSKLEQAVLKFERIYSHVNKQDAMPDYAQLVKTFNQSAKKYKQRFLIAGATAYFRLKTDDIAYFYTENRVTYAVEFNAKEHVLDQTMEKLEEQLDPDVFFRANRSHILNIDSIQTIEHFFGGKFTVKLVLPKAEKVVVSRLKATEFKDWLGK